MISSQTIPHGSGTLHIPFDELEDLGRGVRLVKETKPELVIPLQGLIVTDIVSGGPEFCFVNP